MTGEHESCAMLNRKILKSADTSFLESFLKTAVHSFGSMVTGKEGCQLRCCQESDDLIGHCHLSGDVEVQALRSYYGMNYWGTQHQNDMGSVGKHLYFDGKLCVV